MIKTEGGDGCVLWLVLIKYLTVVLQIQRNEIHTERADVRHYLWGTLAAWRLVGCWHVREEQQRSMTVSPPPR